ncbi:unnamed protein product [Owenia fusiformis]|uniref:Uncharacterized protein n=1 Tax=Owenia fusiformis TaxID=6347 RepID=A0A8J1UET6_OWEFU|nr:unnamed protein product [Owenia fusiformis]
MFRFINMFKCTLFILLLLIWMITVLFLLDTSIKTTAISRKTAPSRIAINMPMTKNNDYVKHFLYIVNANQCISDKLVQMDMLGDPENLDVLVLSYNTPCKDFKLNHVKYTYGPNTTWGSGRNVAWTYAQKHLGKYLYYVFMDEDIILKPTLPRYLSKDALNRLKQNTSILRQFEDFLLDTQPAVGAPFRSLYDPLSIHDFTECCPGKDNHNKHWDLPERIPMIRFDECFAAFHNIAIGHIMPLDVQYDKKSWWGAAQYLHMKSYYYFHRQLARYALMTVHNTQHKSYPQGTLSYVDIINSIKCHIPESHRNATIFVKDLKIMAGKDWGKHVYINPSKPTFELAPENDKITPFKYIDTVRNF